MVAIREDQSFELFGKQREEFVPQGETKAVRPSERAQASPRLVAPGQSKSRQVSPGRGVFRKKDPKFLTELSVLSVSRW